MATTTSRRRPVRGWVFGDSLGGRGVVELDTEDDEGRVEAGSGHRLEVGNDVVVQGRPESLDAFALELFDIGRPVGHRNRWHLEVEHLPPLGLGAVLVLALGLEDGRVVLPAHSRLLDRLGVGLGQRTEPTRGDGVGVAATGVDLIGGEFRCVGHDIATDLAQSALLTHWNRRLVEGHATADRHEVALAGLGGHLRRIEQGGVAVVDDDLAAVDAARGVAPVREGLGLLGKLCLQARLDRVGSVVEHCDVDGLIPYPAHRGGSTGTRFADFAQAGPRTVGGGAGRQHAAGRCGGPALPTIRKQTSRRA